MGTYQKNLIILEDKTMNDIESIKRIREAIDRSKLVVFVGAGVSMNSKLPSWSGLIKRLASSMGIDSNRNFNSEDYLLYKND